MLTFGLISLLRIYGRGPARLHAPRFMQRLVQAGHRRAMNRSPVARAALIGLLTTLLPCGWLYAFVVTAAGGSAKALVQTLPVTATASTVTVRFDSLVDNAMVSAVELVPAP